MKERLLFVLGLNLSWWSIGYGASALSEVQGDTIIKYEMRIETHRAYLSRALEASKILSEKMTPTIDESAKLRRYHTYVEQLRSEITALKELIQQLKKINSVWG